MQRINTIDADETLIVLAALYSCIQQLQGWGFPLSLDG
ncbi:MAG: hypothetical protein CLLPBCKN_007603 [Chroococcidiopsis cubana SAG 39.79]|nr:hypothetical protein [Chroococcidiopsis cubana SAG 39.79]